ncbi:hypothetical protein [Jonesia quinghaiensis]|uniref:hypothetical protein n=1 Tax=Jonesia quinghaiensis TaxID=262806 RepID=UPI0012FA6B4B|nr:hypothetical protein [Jonesia quinghaiensis]
MTVTQPQFAVLNEDGEQMRSGRATKALTEGGATAGNRATRRVEEITLKGFEVREDPSDFISVDITGRGRIDLYNDAKLIEYSWLFEKSVFRIAFRECESGDIIDFQFSGIRNLVAVPDADETPLPVPPNIEFVRFVFGSYHLDIEPNPDWQKNVEFSTNLMIYRFWAEQVEVRVRDRTEGAATHTW